MDNGVKPLVAVSGKKARWHRRAARRWALKILGSELSHRPGKAIQILRRFNEIRKRTLKVWTDAKLMQFGRDDDSPVFKFRVFVPHLPSEAAEMRLRRALGRDSVGPELTTLSMTDECPYKCRHCSNVRRPSKALSKRRVVELVGEIQELGCCWLNIGGGEPGLEFGKSLAVVEAAGQRSETWLNTTGFNLDIGRIKRLKQAGLFGGRVSIHSTEPRRHDEFVGYPGAFKIAAETIANFRQAGILPILSSAVAEKEISWSNIHDLTKLAKDLGAGFAEIIPIKPSGRAVTECNEAELSQQDIDWQILKRLNMYKRFADLPAADSGAYLEQPEMFGCVAGSERMYISASGDVQPCPLVSLSLGNVAEEPLAKVYERMRALLSKPSPEALCYKLWPIMVERLRKNEQEYTMLPIAAEESNQILSELKRGKLC